MQGATLGNLKIPAPKSFAGKREDDTYEFENYSRQLQAYMALQAPRFKELMMTAEEMTTDVGVPTTDEDRRLARVLRNSFILTCTDKARRIVNRDESACRMDVGRVDDALLHCV